MGDIALSWTPSSIERIIENLEAGLNSFRQVLAGLGKVA
jgi:hypothetical protein